MIKIIAILLSVIIVSSFSSVYAEEPIILEQLSPSGQILVKLEWPEVIPLELTTFKVSFHDPITGELLDDEWRINYDLYVMQHDHTVEFYHQQLATDGTGEHEVLFPEESQGLAQVIVELKAASSHGHTIKYFEDVTFSVNVVPEFGVIAAIVLSIAFVPILLLSKSKLMPKF